MEKRKHQVISTPHHHHPTPTTHLYEKKHVVRNRPYLIGTVHFEKATINTTFQSLRGLGRLVKHSQTLLVPVMLDLHINKLEREREREKEGDSEREREIS